MPSVQVLMNGSPVPDLVRIKSDTSTTASFTVVSDFPGASGQTATIVADSLINIDQSSGVLDSTGKWTFIVGPGMLAKGRVTLEAAVQGHKKAFDLLFY